MKNYFSVEGKNAIVTGASSGLGRQFALCLAEQGANVCICARRVDRLEEVKKEIEALGARCLASHAMCRTRTASGRWPRRQKMPSAASIS